MIKRLLLLSLPIALFASCSKDNNGPGSFFITAKVDGISREFNLATTAQQSDGGKSVTIVSSAGTMSNAYPTITIDVEDNAVITAQTYNAAGNNVIIGYLASPNGIFFSGDDFTVTVTAISNSEIKGTFSGNVYDGSQVVAITEGLFHTRFE